MHCGKALNIYRPQIAAGTFDVILKFDKEERRIFSDYLEDNALFLLLNRKSQIVLSFLEKNWSFTFIKEACIFVNN